jgi:hypothetical protein
LSELVTKRPKKRAKKRSDKTRPLTPSRQRHKKGGGAQEVFIENHRYLIWFSREVDTHSYRDFLKNQDWRWLG